VTEWESGTTRDISQLLLVRCCQLAFDQRSLGPSGAEIGDQFREAGAANLKPQAPSIKP
jgi:hypothetical protein